MTEEELLIWMDYSTELMRHLCLAALHFMARHSVWYNVHALLHVHEDVAHFRCSLNEICCFPFENHLQQIKKNLSRQAKTH